MAEATRAGVWGGRLTYIGLILLLIFVQLLPLGYVPGADEPQIIEMPAGSEIQDVPETVTPSPPQVVEPVSLSRPIPDLILLLTLAWAARRPDYVPALSVAAVMLATDILFQRPPGLWAALALLLSEMVRARANVLRSLPFWLEWAGIVVGIVVITLLNRLVLNLVAVPLAPLSLTLIHMTMTCAVYPIIVFVSHLLFGVRRPAPGEVDALGHRL